MKSSTRRSTRTVEEEEVASRGPIKETSVQFRATPSQHDALMRAARREGDTLGNWCRRHLLKLAGWEYEGAELSGR